MFAANPQLELLLLASSSLNTELYELANTGLVDALEWVTRQDTALHIMREEIPCIIARKPHGCLGQVVGAETKKVSMFSDFPGSEASSW